MPSHDRRGNHVLMDEDIYDMITRPKSPEDRQISGIVTEWGQPLSFGNRGLSLLGPGDCLPAAKRSGLFRIVA